MKTRNFVRFIFGLLISPAVFLIMAPIFYCIDYLSGAHVVEDFFEDYYSLFKPLENEVDAKALEED